MKKKRAVKRKNMDSLRVAIALMYLPEFPDGYFDLAIVDPPYGINSTSMAMGTNRNRQKGGYPSVSTTEKVETARGRWHGCGKLAGRATAQMDVEWDRHPPGPEYFRELFRVSKQQIIWGGQLLRPAAHAGDNRMGQNAAVGEFFTI